MPERENMKFCPHCDLEIPARTFRDHHERFFYPVSKRWDREMVLNVVDSDEDEAMVVEMPSWGEHDTLLEPAEENLFDKNDLLDHEVWDEADICDVEDDFPQATGCKSVPSVDVNINSRSCSLNILLGRCLMVLLAYFWTSFNISDNGMEFLLAGLKKCFEIAAASSQWMAGLALVFPGTLYFFRKEIGLVNDMFVKYVVCPCHKLYEFENCYHSVGGRHVSRKCSFVKFPNHRQQWRRQACGASLLKEVSLKCGTKKLYRHRVYCYRSVVESLKDLVKRNDFTAHCELWRNREARSVSQVMGDVFNGRVWREFQNVSEVPFLASPRNYALMLNVDWMQPFKHTIYSVGVLYLVLMNLPRSECFKTENVILVGVIPGQVNRN